MKQQRLIDYIWFGATFGFLRNAKPGYSVFGKGHVVENLKDFKKFIDSSDLKFTKSASWRIQDIINELEKKPKDSILDKEEAKKLYDMMEKMYAVIQTETELLHSYFLTDKRIDVNKLTSDISSLMAPNIYNSLSDSIKYDFSESGKCIAFECATAAGFHSLRGVEGIVRYLLNLVDPAVIVSKMNWGNAISHLRSKKKKDLIIILDNLDMIRSNYRNPTNHPEKIYNIEESQDLFNLCVSVVNQIIEYLKNNSYI